MVKVQTKEKLAKLLAMEDIDVEHRQVRTAMFDVKNRCLVLPTWKDMPNHLYDLLVGHEVGHALYTPNNEKQLKSIIKKSSKHCVNVVEDARIEALMKRRYPGLVKQFFQGYDHLVKEDFFGLSKINLSAINFLDKLNLHFKIPTAVTGLFEFNEIEQGFVDRIAKIKKFSEVEKICVEICDYIKENREEDEDEDSIFDEDSHTFTNEENEDDMGEEQEVEKSEAGEGEEDAEEGESEQESNEASKEENENDEGQADGVDSGELNDEVPNAPSNISNEPTWDDTPDDLKSETYENFEDSMKDLTDIKTENMYACIPDNVRYDNLIDFKSVYKNVDSFYSLDYFNSCKDNNSQGGFQGWTSNNEQFKEMVNSIFKRAKDTLEKIKKESVKNVNHMAMDFERKKSADIYKRTSFAKTGVLDTNKMYSAKYNDDVFKKNMKTPDGKNHGLVMIVDWSGSMSIHMEGCAKQLVEFVLFCKKVNIPFEVYSFSDINTMHNRNKKETFIYKPGDLKTDNKITLRNYFSSRMNARELNEAMLKFCVITNSFNNGYQQYPIPSEDQLGYTPLNGAILFSEHIVRDFQKRNNLQEVHMVWITDGEGNNQWSIEGLQGSGRYSDKKLIIHDKKTKKQYQTSNRRHNVTAELFKIIKDRLGCNIIGFFLDSNFGKKHHMMNHIYRSAQTTQNMNVSEWMKKAKKDGYFLKDEPGYDEYYVISNNTKIVKPVEMTEKMTNAKLATVFSNKNNQFKNTRVILSKFIDLITAKI